MEPLAHRRALELARQLTLIPDFPRHAEAIEAIARFLTVWCTWTPGWPPEQQAAWLVDTACLKWNEWAGVAALEEMHRVQFHPEFHPVPASNEVKDYGEKPPILCHKCNDSGIVPKNNGTHEWCECERAKQLKADFPDWLDLCNRPRQPEKPRPKPSNIALIKPLTQTDIDAELKRQGRKPSGGDAA